MSMLSATSKKPALLIYLLYLFLAGPACADVPQLWQGMGQAQVLKLKGPATERMEFESKREEKWLYPDEELGFKEGKLVSWWNAHVNMFAHIKSDAESFQSKSEKSDLHLAAETKKPQQSRKDPERVQNLLQEVFRDLPSDSPGPSVPAGPMLMK